MFKSTILILLGLVVLTFASCEKDSDSEKMVEEIVGVWTISSSSVEAKINNVELVQYFMNAFDLSEEDALDFTDEFIGDFYGEISGTANFKSDGTYIIATDGSTDSGTYKMNADDSKITLDEGTEDEIVMDVITLTSSKLELSFTETEVEDMDGDEIDDTLKITVTLILAK